MPPQKSPNMTDVAKPGSVAPPPTGRPIIVTNHSGMAADPMLSQATKSPEGSGEALVNRVAKTITPTESVVATDGTPVAPETVPGPVLPTVTKPPVDESNSEPRVTDVLVGDLMRDTEAAKTAAETAAIAAEEARKQEIEDLIQKGTYAVPINAVGRKRSRMFVTGMFILTIILLIAALDLALDANLFTLPFSVPHTDLFAGV